MSAGLVWARYYPDHGNRLYMRPDLAINKCGKKCWVHATARQRAKPLTAETARVL